jgi:hypothetical protein
MTGQREQLGPAWTRIVFADVPANGRVMGVSLTDDNPKTPSSDATIYLPARSRIRVQILDPDLQATIGTALAADAAVEITTDNPDVVIASTSMVDAAQASLRFVPTQSQDDTVLLHCQADSSNSRRDVLAMFSQLGISEVDAMDAAQATGRSIAIGAKPSDGARSVTMWRELLSPRFNFVQSRSFPLFVARSIRWLAGITEDLPYLAAGEPSALVSTPRRTADNKLLDPVGSDFIPPVAGTFTHVDGSAVIASAFPLSPAGNTATIPDLTNTAGDTTITWGLIVALLVLSLLIFEWFLLTTGRIP